ncbi:HAD hydrolase-like protein [Bacillus sp. RG28]|uniref:HAD hydrolase-like protein n=1 Tax=Gottfriedia endophytica TaxID=2820819 RepID=A0A940NSD7_9BACI|nr:HAD hydrolase-like protein [Gottfriedia endophytica]MBP0726668.1 HAD hydrolase-like protein [Gottfriedia endophytica]
MYNAIIFDMDGTLFQTNTILEPSLIDTFDKLRDKGIWNGSTPLEKYQQIMGVTLPVVWETLLPDTTIEIREYANELFHERLIENIKLGKGALYPNVIKTLDTLKEIGIPMYIASNGLIKYLDAIVLYFGLKKWISETFSIQQINSLDKSDLVKMIIEKNGIKIGAVVGDRLSDIMAAKTNGLTAIGCHFDFAKEEELKEADIVIHNFDELRDFCVQYKR